MQALPHEEPGHLLVIDGNSLAHRAWHAYGPRDERPALTLADGTPVFAVHGFFSMLSAMLRLLRPTHLAVGFDSRTNNRKVAAPHYKAQRQSADPDLYRQMDVVRDLLGRVGVASVVIDGWEADDVVGSFSRACTERGIRCTIATSDRDSFQLVSDTTTVWRITNGVTTAESVTPEWLWEKYAVRDGGYLDLAALRGDASDNLPGVAGVGEKTAKQICALGPVAGTIERLLAGDAEIEAALGRAAKKLRDGHEAFVANRQIMEIRTDLDVDVDAAKLGMVPTATVLRELTQAGLASVASRLGRQLGG
jgi:DNA polymerase-1